MAESPKRLTQVARRRDVAALLLITALPVITAGLLLSCQSATIPSDSEDLATGVVHHYVNLIEGPWAIHVVEVNLPRAWRDGIRLRAARAHSSEPSLAKTSVLAAEAIAGINGDLWYRDTPGRTLGLQITEGHLIEEPRKQSAFAITDDGKPLVAVFTTEAGLITSSGETLSIPAFNRAPSNGGLTYYNRFANVKRDSIRAEFGFHLESLRKQSVINDTVVARVRQVRRRVWPLRLRAGEWLVAAGRNYPQASSISAGDTVQLFLPPPPRLGELARGGRGRSKDYQGRPYFDRVQTGAPGAGAGARTAPAIGGGLFARQRDVIPRHRRRSSTRLQRRHEPARARRPDGEQAGGVHDVAEERLPGAESRRRRFDDDGCGPASRQQTLRSDGRVAGGERTARRCHRSTELMPRFQAEALRQLGVDLFTKIDVPADEAELVAGHMVESGLYGHDSHSVLRYPQYVELVRKGDVIPGAQLEIVTETDRVAQVKGNWNFGPVTAAAAMKIAMAKARDGALGVVTIKECNHVARLGSFARMAADETMIAMMCCNGHGGDHSTVPFGGSQRRLPTNPLAVAIPTRREWPVLLDMTTSAISGGAMRLFRNRGEPVPEDCIIDSDGSPTTDVEEYYGPPSERCCRWAFP